MLPFQSAHITRLAACCALSVLLHALLLLALNAPGGRGHEGRRQVDGRDALIVRLASVRREHPAAAPESASTIPAPALRPAGSPPAVAPQTATNTWPGLLSIAPTQPSTPEMEYQTQMHYQQMQAMNAQRLAQDQRRFVISRLQANIERGLDPRNGTATGRCVWQGTGDGPALRCDPVSLAALLRAQTQDLAALSAALRSQGSIMEGFSVVSKEGRRMIEYQIRSAPAEDAQ